MNFGVLRWLGGFSLYEQFLQIFPCGKSVKNCLWMSIGSACCFRMDSKQGLVCKAVSF